MERIIPEHETIEIEFKSDVKKLSDSDLIVLLRLRIPTAEIYIWV